MLILFAISLLLFTHPNHGTYPPRRSRVVSNLSIPQKTVGLDRMFSDLFKPDTNATHFRSEKWPDLAKQMNKCLKLHREGQRLNVAHFNKFLKAMITLGIHHNIAKFDSWYLKAFDARIPMTIVTFNTLFRGIRLSQPFAGGLARARLSDCIDRFHLRPDGFTVIEMLCMCARRHGHFQKQIAESWFEYYLKYIQQNPNDKANPAHVMTSYLNVFAQDGDLEGMEKVFNLAKDFNLGNNLELVHTLQKGYSKK